MSPEVRMSYRHLSDEAFVHAFESCRIAGQDFRHADHVRLAWIYVTRYGLREAEDRFCEGLIRLATHLGVGEKFHLTITVAWLRIVAAHVAPHPVQPFDVWIAGHPGLLDRGFLRHYYSEESLAHPDARKNWREPDRRSLSEARIAEANPEKYY